MTTKVTVDFGKELARIRKEFAKTELKSVEERTKFAVSALKRTTPIDTGYARSRWEYEIVDGVGIIENDAPYIDVLNKGHSQQAPTHFIEITLAAVGELTSPVFENTSP